jgi:hypothetical protein
VLSPTCDRSAKRVFLVLRAVEGGGRAMRRLTIFHQTVGIYYSLF